MPSDLSIPNKKMGWKKQEGIYYSKRLFGFSWKPRFIPLLPVTSQAREPLQRYQGHSTSVNSLCIQQVLQETFFPSQRKLLMPLIHYVRLQDYDSPVMDHWGKEQAEHTWWNMNLASLLYNTASAGMIRSIMLSWMFIRWSAKSGYSFESSFILVFSNCMLYASVHTLRGISSHSFSASSLRGSLPASARNSLCLSSPPFSS